MDQDDLLSRQTTRSSFQELQELEPSPVDDSPSDTRDSYFPSSEPEQQQQQQQQQDGASDPRPTPLKRSSTLGLNSHSPVWYLTRIQKYSSYAFSVFAAFHITNTSLIPLATRSVSASEPYLLLTRPYYQSWPLAEPFVVALPLLAHVGSGIALRLYRRKQSLEWSGAETRRDKRQVPWPKVSGTSKLGYVLTPLVLGHAFVNRVLPLWKEGGSSSINLSYVSHAFARHPAVSFVGFAALIAAGAWHTVWGWAKWWNLAPAQVTMGGVEGQVTRKRRWYAVNAVSALVAALWMAGGLGVVGRGGRVDGWVGREYDELYQSIPIVGRWM
ncbi:hypothetical protein H2203_007272 [Taxawa tesnikishii (nom. ined.)]|nr:hypothetical protein H2203_007272 [Dothideales sp. JES 119]